MTIAKCSAMEYVDILGVKIAAVNLEMACDIICKWIEDRHKTYVCLAPVATLIDCYRDSVYLDIVNSAAMTTPDGMPLVWIARLKGSSNIGRTYGPDLMLSVCQKAEKLGYRHFFYGGTESGNKKLISNLKKRFPRIKVAGCYAPPIIDNHTIENKQVLSQINSSSPDILWVGLGSPKQDFWMYNHRSRLDVPVMIGVGAAFDFVAGIKPQAPVWMRHLGLEWLFRLCSEPRRLWRRYLIGNTLFLYLLLRDWNKIRALKGDRDEDSL